jgi:hypothetical protein
MKRLFVIGSFVLSLMGNPCHGIEFCKDVLEFGNPGGPLASFKTWDEEWIKSRTAQVEVDIWINDVPEQLLTAGIYLEFDPSQMDVLSAEVYGHWDQEMSSILPNGDGPGTFIVLVGNLGNVTPDREGDIHIAKLRLDCVSDCNVEVTVKTIPGFDTVVGDSAVTYDESITPNIFTIEEGTPPCASEALYGKDSPESNLLRAFRDSSLSKTSEGRELIKLYYQLSPTIVKAMEADEDFRQEVKEMIDEVLLLIAR